MGLDNALSCFLRVKILNKRNITGNIASISCFDFSTLHTETPLDKLFKVLKVLTDFCFKGRDVKLIPVDSHWNKWMKERKSGLGFFTKNNLEKAVNYILLNCFVKLGIEY